MKTQGIFEKEGNIVENKDLERLRASFMNYPPACMKDTRTGNMRGIFVDILQKVCDNLGLILEWTEEVGWASQIEGLESDRYDIVGSPVWANPKRGKLATLSIPVYYSAIGVFVRANENRFSSNLDLINNPNVRIGTIDGESADLIARTDYPKATRISSAQTTDFSQILHDLATNKCDVFFTEPYFANEFLINNPDTIKNIAETNPIRLYGNCYMIKRNSFQQQQMLNVTIQGLIDIGYVDKVIAKYVPNPREFFRTVNIYKEIEKNIDNKNVVNNYNIMGDNFDIKNAQNFTFTNKSNVVNSFNKVKEQFDETTASVIQQIAEIVEKSKNDEAVELFDAFNEEITKPAPKKSVLKSIWSGLSSVLPVLSTTVSIVEKVIKIIN